MGEIVILEDTIDGQLVDAAAAHFMNINIPKSITISQRAEYYSRGSSSYTPCACSSFRKTVIARVEWQRSKGCRLDIV